MVTHRTLTNGEIDETWLEYLTEFNKKIAFLETYKLINMSQVKGDPQKQSASKAVLDIEPKINKLKEIVCHFVNFSTSDFLWINIEYLTSDILDTIVLGYFKLKFLQKYDRNE